MDKTLDNDNDDNEQLQKYSPQQLDEEEEDEIDQFAQRVRQKTQIFTGTKNLWRKASDQYRKDRQNINRTLIYQKNEQQNQANPSLFKELQTDRYIVLNDLKCKHIRRSCHCSILDATLRVICSEEEESNVVKHWGLRSLQRLIVNIRRSGSYSYDNLNGLPSYSYQTCRMAINAAEMWGSWGIWGRDQLCNQAKISDSLQQSSSENTLQSETSQFSSSTSQSPQIEDNNNNSNSNYKQDSINNTFLSSQRFQQLFSNAVNAFNKSCEMYGIGPSGFSGRGFCEGYWGRSGYSKPIREMNPRNYNRNTYHEPKESCILYVLQYIIGCSEGQNVDKDLVNEDENANQNIENENEKKQKEQNEQNNSSSDDDNNNQQQSSFTEYFDPNGALLQNSEQNQINLIDTASYCNYIYRSLNKYCEMASFDCSQEHKMNKNEYVYNIDDYSHSNDNISLFTLPLHQSNKPISSQIQIKPQILVPPPPLIFLLSLDEEFNRRLISAEVFDYTFDVFEEEGTYEGLDILNFHSYNQVARNSVDIVYLIENMKQWRPYLFKDYTMLCRRCALHYWNINAQNDIKTQYQSSYIQTERDNMNIDHQDGVNNYNQQNENMVNNEDAASSSEYAEVTSQSEESDEISSQSDSNISDTFEE
ncbi:MAG: hypothetical protein EZS28_020419 [Streblomastix strix]|uniref:Uncharacterized protein n=1 Tax=Streblomastix strix TaxID=222440 RepID=A0A5J4VNJ5_9EUKA|nr:MAG: hypothetical protein EZS28_020419 [Streblomastix strix]